MNENTRARVKRLQGNERLLNRAAKVLNDLHYPDVAQIVEDVAYQAGSMAARVAWEA